MFVAFQRHTEEDPWGHELILNFDLISKIEVMYFSKPDAENRSFRFTLKDGRGDPSTEKWFVVYTGGDKVTVTRRHGKVFHLVESIIKKSLKSESDARD